MYFGFCNKLNFSKLHLYKAEFNSIFILTSVGFFISCFSYKGKILSRTAQTELSLPLLPLFWIALNIRKVYHFERIIFNYFKPLRIKKIISWKLLVFCYEQAIWKYWDIINPCKMYHYLFKIFLSDHRMFSQKLSKDK